MLMERTRGKKQSPIHISDRKAYSMLFLFLREDVLVEQIQSAVHVERDARQINLLDLVEALLEQIVELQLVLLDIVLVVLAHHLEHTCDRNNALARHVSAPQLTHTQHALAHQHAQTRAHPHTHTHPHTHPPTQP